MGIGKLQQLDISLSYEQAQPICTGSIDSFFWCFEQGHTANRIFVSGAM